MLFPLGILVPLCIRKADNVKKVALAGLFVSFAIEVAQLITTRGYFELDDIFHNTLGAFLGGLIGCPLARRIYSENKN